MSAPSRCVVLTGPVGAGKSSMLRKAAETLVAEGRRIAFVLQPDEGRGSDAGARGFAMELLSGADGRLEVERMHLAQDIDEPSARRAGGLIHGRFLFDAGAFDRAETFIRGALGEGSMPDAIGLDEIGRLELRVGKGLRASFDLALSAVAAARKPRLLLCAAREDLAPEVARRAEEAGLDAMVIDVADRADCIDLIRGFFIPS